MNEILTLFRGKQVKRETFASYSVRWKSDWNR
jgi:hypothetical protein